MGLFSMPISLLLGFSIIMVEILRRKPKDRIDFLSGVNAVYLICFSIAPVFLITSNISSLPNMGWLHKNPFESPIFLYASVLSIIGYIAILSGYFLTFLLKRNAASKLSGNTTSEEYEISDELLFIAGVVLFLAGIASLFIYVNSIGGFLMSIKYAAAFRGKNPPVITKWSFLKSLAPLVQMSSYFFYALKKDAKSDIRRWCSGALFLAAFCATIFLLYHDAGRLSMASYLLVFLLAECFEKGKVNAKLIIVCGLVSLAIILFGDSIFVIFIRRNVVADTLSSYRSNPGTMLKLLMSEFSFPFATLGNAIKSLNCLVNMRFFYDIPLAIIYLIPKRIFNIKLPPYISELNTALFDATGAVPVDIVSFGYYSMGIAGVMITCFTFGIIIKAIEIKLRNVRIPILAIFKAEWIIALSFAVMYGDPVQFVKSNFPLFVATALLTGVINSGKRDIRLKGWETK